MILLKFTTFKDKIITSKICWNKSIMPRQGHMCVGPSPPSALPPRYSLRYAQPTRGPALRPGRRAAGRRRREKFVETPGNGKIPIIKSQIPNKSLPKASLWENPNIQYPLFIHSIILSFYHFPPPPAPFIIHNSTFIIQNSNFPRGLGQSPKSIKQRQGKRNEKRVDREKP